MISVARIGLGTAQFGARYGISNSIGKPSEAEVEAILSSAAAAGIIYLDTAASYGDAERLIGKYLPSGNHIRIVTKVAPTIGQVIDASYAKSLLDSVAASLGRLNVNRLYGLMIHHASDLAKPGWQYLVHAMREAQARGLVARVGASVYDANEIALVESRFRPELVQVPFNALDRRLVASGCLDRLHALGTEVHVRSVFLQGLLLMKPADIRGFFTPMIGGIASLQAGWRTAGLTPVAGCLQFALQQNSVDVVIVGVNRESELEEIKYAVEKVARSNYVDSLVDPLDELYLDPRKWPAMVN